MANSESPQRPDLQDLVAYMQGRGSETLRAQVLKRLDEDEAYMDLMIDLVPMLREAGECGDPDVEAEPAPAPLRLVAPQPVVAPAPAVDPPTRGNVIVAPDRFYRNRGLIAALAALVPIAVAVWQVVQNQVETPRRLARYLSIAQFPKGLDEPLDSGATRGLETSGSIDPATAADLFKVGARLLDLELAIQQQEISTVKERLDRLAFALEKDEASELRIISTELEANPVKWSKVEASPELGLRVLLLRQRRGAVCRAGRLYPSRLAGPRGW